MVGSSELSGSAKGGEFLDQVSEYHLRSKDSFMERFTG